VRVVLVEDASRFARDLVAQELGVVALIKLGMRVLTATGDDLTSTNDPMKVAMRQIAGAFSQLEKARLVAKLKAAREQRKEKYGKCEGRKGYAEAMPATVELAKRLHADGLSYRKISAALAAQGDTTGSGKPHWKYKKQVRAQKKFYTRIWRVKAPFHLISGYREAVKAPERNRLKALARS
jgi:DNA invertase Pin-like site-specific DNA recombinase